MIKAWLGAGTAAIAFCSAAPAFSQTAQQPSTPEIGPAEVSDDEDEQVAATQGRTNDNVIIVTATRRAQDVQDIPLAVTAVAPVELERQGVQDIKTLEVVSASFNLNSSQTESQGTTIRIRGIGTTGNNIGLESAVGVFIDGVYQSRPGVALGDLVDLEQLEILRGPQGTLFGRNTTAGALNIRTRRPNLNEFEGYVNATYGNYDAFNAQAGVSVPVAPGTLGVRLSGAYRVRDGFLDNAVTGGEENNRDRWLVRGQALWEPTLDLSIRLIADYQKTNERCCDAVQLNYPALASPALRAELFPGGIVNRTGLTGSNLDIRERDLIANSQGFENDVEQWGVSGELVWDFGPVEMTYIGSYRDFLGESRQDEFNGTLVYSVSGATFPPGFPATFDDIKTQTHELRFQGSAFNDVFDWLVGVYYSDETIIEEFALGLGEDYARVVSEANTGNPAFLDLITSAGNFLASGATNPANFVPTPSGGSFALNRFEQDAESFSVFTHNIINFTDSLSLTLGARYVDDTKDGSLDQLQSNNPFCASGLALLGSVIADPAGTGAALAPILGAATPGFLANAGTGAFLTCFPFAAPVAEGPLTAIPFLPQEFDDTFEDDELIYTIQGGWEPNPDILIYGGFTHGYKAGGFNLDVTAAAGGGDPRFRSEVIDAYEVGIKTTVLNGRGRFNVAAFYNDITDFQVLEFTGTNFQTFNVQDVTSKGVEVEASANWNDYVSSNLAVTYTDAAYGENCDDDGAVPEATGLCGNDLTNAPEWVGIFGMTYDGPIAGSDWGFLATTTARYESSRRTRTNPESGPFDVQEANLKVNARIGVTTPDERFSFEVWGNNLTNVVTRNVTFNTPLLGNASSAFVQEPRTYGITARANF